MEPMLGMLGRVLLIIRMGCLATESSVLARGRVTVEEIASTRRFITVSILTETMATTVTLIIVAMLQTIMQQLGLDLVMAGMLLVLLDSPNFSSGW
jgi:hypothetical protein